MSGISYAVNQVSIDQIPELLLPWWQYIVVITGSVPWIALAGFGRNVFGFARIYFRKDRTEEFDYNKLYETLTLYVGGITTIVSFTSMLPEPWNEIVGGILSAGVVIIDLVLSEIRHMREQPS